MMMQIGEIVCSPSIRCWRKRGLTRLLDCIGALVCLLVGISCGSDQLATQPNGGDTLYASLTLTHHAITLSTAEPYDTLSLSAVARNPFGVPLASAGTPTYSSGDVVSLSVAADGSLQAHAAAVGIPVIATLQVDNVTHTDTSYVDIRDEGVPSPIANISIHPQAPDSAKIAAAYSFPKQLVVRAQDVQGDSVAGLHVEFRSSDPTIAFVDPLNGFVTGERAGNVLIIATATIYGASHVDTLPFAVGLPITYIVNVAPSKVPNSTPSTTFTPSEIHVGRGAVVSFAWVVDIRPVDITFDDPTHVAEDTVNFFGGHTGGGDIAPPDGCKSAVPFASLLNCIKGRAFPDAGVYAYHSTLTGAAGQVIVVDESASGNP